MRVLGIDPGSRITGFGVIERRGTRLGYITSGCIKANTKQDYLARLPSIVEGIEELVQQYQPQQACIERAFVSANPGTALKLGQVRGLAMALFIQHSIPIFEYSPREVKKLVSGQGNAAKQQVQYMVQRLLNLSAQPSEDAADALALAITHIYTQ